MKTQEKPRFALLVRSILELAGVTVLVFGTGWFGLLLAQQAHRHPVGPGRDGTIELRLAKSDRYGDVSFIEGSGYAGWWHCQGKDWKVEWRFAPPLARAYDVEARVSSPQRLNGQQIEVAAGDQALKGVVADTGGAAKWQVLKLGKVALEARPYTLTVTPGSEDLTNLNLKSITLRPAPPAAAK